MLAARWSHRKSTDIDVFLPGGSGITTLDPRWNPRFTNRMSALGASRIEVQDRSIKFSFPAGRIEITQIDPVPNIAPETAIVEDREVAVYNNSQILTGKLYGRGRRLPERDIFDIVVARHEDPGALRAAVNFLDEYLHTEIIHLLRMEADAYAEEAPETIIEPAPRWIHLLRQGPEKAIEAIELSAYRTIDIRYSGNGISVELAAGNGWKEKTTFESGRELAGGLTRLGLDRLMLREHRSVGDFIRDADAKMTDA